MYRITTPTHTFTLPINTDTLKVIKVTYRQAGPLVPEPPCSNPVIFRPVVPEDVILSKKYENGTLPSGMTLDGKKVVIRLTQEETKMFFAGFVVIAQVRVLTNDDDAFASQYFTVLVNEVNDEEVLQ